eukprot:SAG31_NODE_225_length_19846_cov_19.057983_4_plen_30_part_00
MLRDVQQLLPLLLLLISMPLFLCGIAMHD